mmetsp:Transcript_13754/g.20838  ORF Transcript_13754/g.20838 Transcript_13754/m.20838 type:complete len:407 (-) Transcript_13754:1382-2602(-)
MQHLVDTIKRKTDDGELDKLVTELDQNLDKIRMSVSKLSPRIFETLPIANYTLGLCYLIATKAVIGTPKEDTIFMMQRILQEFDVKQARLASRKFGVIINIFTKQKIEDNQAKLVMPLLLSVLNKFQISKHHLTPIHSAYLSCALTCKRYAAASKLLKHQILEIEPSITGLTPKDMLLFYYYGGMVHCGLKNWDEAVRFFSIALTVPAHVLSSIVIESFKKYLLVGYLAEGKILKIPKHASVVVSRSLESFATQYIDFLNTLTSGEKMGKDFMRSTKSNETFKKDNTIGLTLQCIEAKKRRKIQELTSTYLTIGLSNIAELVNVNEKEVESLLLQMIENGEIRATISQRDAMVVFTDADDQTIEEAMKELNSKMAEAVELSNRMKEMDKKSITFRRIYMPYVTSYR